MHLKKLMTTITTASLGLIIISHQVTAQEKTESTKTQDTYFDGFYLGIDAGAIRADLSLLDLSATSAGPQLSFADAGTTGFTYGGYVGYRKQFDSGWTLGLESGFRGTTGSLEVPVAFDLTSQWRALATAGHVFGTEGRNHIYGAIGVSGLNTNIDNGGDTSLEGVTGALGYERAVTKYFRLRVAVEYTNYDDALDFTVWNPTVGLSYHF